jgi:hypothetical protein
MSRESPTLDDLYGVGAEKAEAWGEFLETLQHEHLDAGCPYPPAAYIREIERIESERATAEGQAVSAGEEVDRLRGAIIECLEKLEEEVAGVFGDEDVSNEVAVAVCKKLRVSVGLPTTK